jgi:hypothetical protein
MGCDKHRAVTLLCKTHKILEYVLYVKSVPYAEAITKRIARKLSKEKINCWSNFCYEKNNGKILGTN